MKIALLGFGTVGRSVYDTITRREAAELNEITIKRVLVRREFPEADAPFTRDFSDILNDPAIDTVVEAIGGQRPAYDYVSSALLAGKNAVTANKAMLCRFYRELSDASKNGGGTLLFEASCAGGIPWIKNLRRAKLADRITLVGGILNGTSNYILDLAQSESLDPGLALAQAQMKGFAEADPSDDIDGVDTARKIAISANLAFDVCLHEDQFPTAGIRRILPLDIKFFKDRGFVCRLAAVAGKSADGVFAVAEPMLFRRSSPMAAVSLNNNYVFLDGRATGRLGFFGQGAGGPATANAVVQDLLEISSGSDFMPKIRPFTLVQPPKRRYYIRAKGDFPGLGSLPGKRIEAGEYTYVLTEPVEAEAVHGLLKKASNGELFFASFAEDETA
jgi:homoserine dehydrogenase